MVLEGNRWVYSQFCLGVLCFEMILKTIKKVLHGKMEGSEHEPFLNDNGENPIACCCTWTSYRHGCPLHLSLFPVVSS